MSDIRGENDKLARMVLGTAQLGLDYGIANISGKPSRRDALQILETAWNSGVTHFDTAPAYNSETLLGDFIKANGIENEINVLTKFSSVPNTPNCKRYIRESITRSMESIGCNAIKVVFFHDANDLFLLTKEPEFFTELLNLYPISSLGVSVYEPSEIKKLDSNRSDIAFQFPYNILDRRFENNTISPGKRYGRSIFLQGLLASESLNSSAPEELKQIHSKIREICVKNKVSILSQAIQFAANSKSLDFFLVGVERPEQLKEIIAIVSDDTIKLLNLDYLQSLISDKWLDPRNWH